MRREPQRQCVPRREPGNEEKKWAALSCEAANLTSLGQSVGECSEPRGSPRIEDSPLPHPNMNCGRVVVSGSKTPYTEPAGTSGHVTATDLVAGDIPPRYGDLEKITFRNQLTRSVA